MSKVVTQAGAGLGQGETVRGVAQRLPASSVRAAQAAEVVSQLVERLDQLYLPCQGQSCPLAMEGLRPLEELLTGEELAVNLDFVVPSA